MIVDERMNRKKLLILHQGALGDFVVTFPVLHVLKRRFQHIDMLTSDAHGRLAHRLGLVDAWHPLESARFLSFYADSLTPDLREMCNRYNAILLLTFSKDLEANVRRHTNVPVRCIPPRPKPAEKIHVSAFLLDRLKDSGLMEAHYVSESPQMNHNLPSRKGSSGRSSTIVIHPGAGSRRKMWPLSRFLSVADDLSALGLSPVFLLGPAESVLLDDLKSLSQSRHPVHRVENVIDLLELLVSANGFIGNDSGVAHLAGYCGIPTVAVFGPSDPVRWRPLGPAVAVVAPVLDCEPCFEIDPETCPEDDCLGSIHPTRVVEAFTNLFNSSDR